MQRRLFLKFGAGALAGSMGQSLGTPLIASPSKLLSIIEPLSSLPKSVGNVRHGLFQMRPVFQPFLPEWLTVFEPQRMFRNGIDAGDDDLFTFSFEINKSVVTICYSVQDVAVIDNQISTSSGTIKGDQSTVIFRGSANTETDVSDGVFVVLRGSAVVNGESVDEGQFVVLDHKVTVEQSDFDSLSLLIHHDLNA